MGLSPLPHVWTGAEILDLPMQKNDANASTVREYLCDLLAGVWAEGQIRIQQGWRIPLYDALGAANVPSLPNRAYHVQTYDALVHNAIRALAGRVADR